MKNISSKLAFWIVCLLISIVVSACNLKSNGIHYNITSSEDKTVEVSNDGENFYNGSVVIPALVTIDGTTYSVTSIGRRAFMGCKGLTSITIPNSVTYIGEYAFFGCSGLTSVTIPNSITSIEDCVFQICSGLTLVTIPNSVTSIGWKSFFGCKGLTSITIPNSVTSIDRCAFEKCTGLTSITIPNSVTSISDYAFGDCTSLTKFIVDSENNNYTALDGVLFNKDKTTLMAYPNAKSPVYTIPNSVTKIGDAAFSKCTGLTSVVIPNSVTKIGITAFSGCSGLTRISIPNSVTEIGDWAFSSCTGLKEIYNYSEKPQHIGEDIFENFDTKTCTLYVPKGAVEAYRVSSYGKKFLNIKEF